MRLLPKKRSPPTIRTDQSPFPTNDINSLAPTQARPTTTDAQQTSRSKKVNTKSLTGASALTVRQSILPVALVTCLFFLWGFAYGLLDTLNAKFQDALGVTAAKSGGLQAAYFGAYFVSPLTWAGWLVRHVGYRWTFISGLVVYGIGSLMFWPSAKYESFGGFCGSLFIVGSGLSTLETSANPYIATCGPPRLSEMRLQLAQAFQAIGTVVAPLLAARVFFTNVKVDASDPGKTDNSGLENVQWTYLGIAVFVFLLAVVFFFSPIPEVTDADMKLQAEQCSDLTGYEEKPIWKQTKLFFGVAAQFCYVGGQVAVASQFIKYAQESANLSSSDASDRYAIGQGLFAIGRFLAAGLMIFIKPRWILLVFSTGVLIFICLATGIKGEAGVAMISLVLFFESACFPCILTLSIRGLGRHTKRGASWVVAAVSGGAFFPALAGVAADHHNFHIAQVVPMTGFVVSFAFPIYLNTFYAKELDGFRETRIGYKDSDGTIGGASHDQKVESRNASVSVVKNGSQVEMGSDEKV